MFENIPFSVSHPFQLGLLCIVIAITLFYFDIWKRQKAISNAVNGLHLVPILLFISSILISYFCATQLDFLNIWDEQYHVVVARNMAEGSFLTPYLYPPELPTTSATSWTTCGIWLHKPPLFMWQMALSMMVFGKSVLAFRLPYILLSAFATLAMYGIGRRLWGNEVGLWASILFTTNCFWLTIVSGYATCDANDVTFISYVTLSIWALLKYIDKEKVGWAIVVGVFSAAALLTKSYLGLWAIGMWFLYLLFSYIRNQSWKKRKLIHLALASFIALLPYIAWSIYIKANYQALAAFESDYSIRHITEVIEGHGGGAWYYIQNMPWIFGGAIIPLVLGLALAMCVYNARRKPKVLAALGLLVTVFLFFAIVRTKMDSFALQASPIVFCVLAFFIVKSRQWLMKYFFKRWIGALVFCVILIPAIAHHIDFQHLNNLFRIEGQPSIHLVRMRAERQAFEQVAQQITAEKAIVLGIPRDAELAFYYWTGSLGRHHFLNPENRNRYRELGYSIYVVESDRIPEDVRADSTIMPIQLVINY